MAFDFFVDPTSAFLIPFFLLVVVTALHYGERWVLITTLFNADIVAFSFTPPVYSFAILAFEDQLRIATFVILGGAFSGLTGNLGYYRQKAM